MVRKFITVLLLGCLVATAAITLADPAVSVRGGNRDRVAVITAKDFNLKNLEGKVVLVGFWRGADCVLCSDYITWLTKMQGAFGKEGLIVVAVNEDRDSSAGVALANSIHPRSQIVLDHNGAMGASYELEGIPSTYLHDRNLNMRYKFVEFVPTETDSLETAILDLLKQPYKD